MEAQRKSRYLRAVLVAVLFPAIASTTIVLMGARTSGARVSVVAAVVSALLSIALLWRAALLHPSRQRESSK